MTTTTSRHRRILNGLGALGAVGALTAAVTTSATATVIAPTTATAAHATSGLTWNHVDISTGQQFRGLDAVSARVAWVGGSKGGVWRTVDGGTTWDKVSPPGARGKLFRDVEASSASTAQVLSIGNGGVSRIYRTTDAGRHWSIVFKNNVNSAFYDCMSMYPDGVHGLAMSDPVNGKFKIIATGDGGRSWHLVPRAGMPRAVPGEFGFAASGTCLVTAGTGPHAKAYLASGGAAARVFESDDYGVHWRVADSTLPPAKAGGVFSLAFKSPSVGLAVGGDYTDPTVGAHYSALTDTSGKTWLNAGDLGGYRSGVAYKTGRTAIAVGPSGTDVTRDGGRTWKTFSDTDFDAVSCVDGACWASGPLGVVAHLGLK